MVRNPSDLPPSSGPTGPRGPSFPFSRPSFKKPSRGRLVVSIVLAVIFALFLSAKSLSAFFINVLWFDSLNRTDVYWGILRSKAELGLLFSFVLALAFWVNIFISDRLAPATLPNTPQDLAIGRVRDITSKRKGLVRLVVSVVFGLMIGLPMSSHWEEWVLFRNRQSFYIEDAQFNTDVGFYMFRLPFLESVVSWAFGALIMVVLITLVSHFLNGSIRPQDKINKMSAQSKVHISVLLAAAALLRAANYWLSRYNLTRSSRSVVEGALYTDINAQLPAINLMILVSVAVAILLLWNIRQKGWRLPALAVGLWVVVAIVAGAVYPAIVQRFVVQPSVSTRELPFISRNIEATKAAMGLANVERVPTTSGTATVADIDANDIALRDIRQLDPAQMRDRFKLDQGLTSFYSVVDLDVDRYLVDGRVQQLLVASRELNPAGIPNRTWVARHLIYTHGCGIVAAPASVITADGRPNYIDLKVTKPQLYFGDGLDGYALVDTDQAEQACPNTKSSQYDADSGIKISGALRKVAMAVNFGEYNLFGSNLITDKSRMLLVRDVRDRVSKIAPFLQYDSDPYPVVVKGEVSWIIDAFTTSTRYPYAQSANIDQISFGSGLNRSFNYVRNSVKAVVNAYSGDVTFYIVDSVDPIARAWQAAFPKLFRPISEVDPELSSHFRYPEDLFRVQSNIYGKYQFDDATLFFNRDAAWSVAQAPPNAPESSSGVGIAATGIDTVDSATVLDANVLRFSPYYTIFHAPGAVDKKGTFAMLRPFVPFSSDDSRKELRSIMVVSSDPATYGKITVFDLATPLPPGPATIAAEFESEPAISATITPLDQRGSRVTYGDLQIVPVGKSFMYVRPMYVLPDGADAKQVFVRKILAWYNNKSVIGNSVTAVVAQLFPGYTGDLGDRVGGSSTVTTTTVAPSTGGSSPGTTVPATSTSTPKELLAQADALFVQADAALASSPPDFSTYQEKLAQARELVRQALATLAN
ncbi:MAG: hypothetical protein EXQ64_01500 [Ilumatobacteraceae bacterium]|nr:hypothetical protein [Ilumatobacteraceae bacterium]